MGFLLLGIAVCVEIGFVVWTYGTKQRHDLEKEIIRIGGFLILCVLLAAGVLEEMIRYGMFLAILAVQIIINGVRLFMLRRAEVREGAAKKRTAVATKGRIAMAIGCVLLYANSLIPAFLFPQHEEPKVTGEHQVLTAEYTWVDESRVETYTTTGENRELTVKFWYPEEQGSYPLLVFSHGAFGVIDSNHSTCQELASNGYVVASIGHTYQSMFLENTSGKVFTVSPEFMNQVYTGNGTRDPEVEKIVYENSKEWMTIRTADENFVLDTILSMEKVGEKAPFDLINSEKIGLFGHSMGGATAVALGRLRDDIDAVIDLEGTMLGEYVDFQNGRELYNEEPYTVPVLDVNSAKVDKEAQELEQETGIKYVNFYLAEHALDYHYEVIEGAGHLNFTDLPMISPILAKMLGVGDVNARDCIEEINDMVLQFFDHYLKENGE